MANHVNRNNFDENAEDIHNDVSQLADTLEEVLKSWGSDAKEEAEAARVKAQSLLKETRARLNGHGDAGNLKIDKYRPGAPFSMAGDSIQHALFAIFGEIH